MSYLLYYNPDSANLVIRMALEEMGLDYDDRFVARRHHQRDAAFHQLNPRGLLPVLVDQKTGAVVFETGAALLYLSEREGKLGPSGEDPQARAKCLKWLFMLSNTLHADLRLRFYSDRYVSSPDHVPSLRQMVRDRVMNHLALIDRELSSHAGSWFLPFGLSVCDFYLGCCVRWAQAYPKEARMLPREILALENLTGYLQTLQERPSVLTAMNREGLHGPAFIEPVV